VPKLPTGPRSAVLQRGFMKRGDTACLRHSTASGSAEGKSVPGALARACSGFNSLFALWLLLAAVIALRAPPVFAWVRPSYYGSIIGAVMFSVGITTTLDDFRKCLQRPGAVILNFVLCYGAMPVLAFILAKLMGADGPILAGLVLVGSVNGGQASNLCTLIAQGDVALSVLMTTSTTLGCAVMTPLIAKLALGAVVPVNSVGILMSTFQTVLLPIFLGVALNQVAPSLCGAIKPISPVIGIILSVLIVGASVAMCAGPIMQAGLPLQLACFSLHAIGGLLGYYAAQLAGFKQRVCRTMAIEVAMKSSAFGFLLASLHFGVFNVRVPSAVSIAWMAITGSLLAVYWKGRPVTA